MERAEHCECNSTHSTSFVVTKSGSGIVRSGAAPKIPAELLWPGRRGFFRCLLFSTSRLALVMLSRSRRAASLLLLLSLRALHSFSWGAGFTRGSATSWWRDRLTKSRRRTSAALPAFTFTGWRRRAETLTLRSSVAPLWLKLPWSTLAGTWLFA